MQKSNDKFAYYRVVVPYDSKFDDRKFMNLMNLSILIHQTSLSALKYVFRSIKSIVNSSTLIKYGFINFSISYHMVLYSRYPPKQIWYP